MKTVRFGAALLALVFIWLTPAASWSQNSGGLPAPSPTGAQSMQAPAAQAPAVQAPVSPRPGAALGASGFPGSILDIGWALGAFVLVLVLLYFGLKGLGRLGRFRGGGRGRSVFELKGIQALDSRNYLAAVELAGRMLVVGVSQDRITPLAHWFIDEEDGGLDFAQAKLPKEDSILDIKLPGSEEEDSPLDISIADSQRGPRK